jgi:hypothetical protein
VHVRAGRRKLAILGVNRSVRRPRNRIIGIALAPRVFANDARARVLLTGKMFEFRDAGETEVVRIIHYRGRLKPFAVQRRMLKFEGAIWELAITQIEKLIDRSSEDKLPICDLLFHIAIVGVESDLDLRMIEHVFEHARVTMLRHRLELIGEVPIVAIRAHGDARGHLRVQFGGIHAPLFAGVAAEKFLVKFAADFTDNNILRRAQTLSHLGHGSEKLGGLRFREIVTVKFIDRVEIYWHRHKVAVYFCEHAMLVTAPCGKARQVIENLWRIGVENVRAVFVHENAGRVVMIECISTDVVASIANEHGLPQTACETFSENTAGKPSADDKIIEHVLTRR